MRGGILVGVPRLTVAFAATLTFALAACGSTSPAPSQAAPARDATGTATSAAPQASAAAGLRLVRVGSFDQPLYVTAPRGDTRRVFVVEQGGTIRVVRGGKVLRTPFLDIRSQVVNSGEQGLLSMAFAPDYARSGRFYVYFTDRGEQQRIVE
jgi:glucose/arabinose dehydrogenase